MRVLLTGSSGVVGTEVAASLAGAVELTRVTRRPRAEGEVAWALGAQPPPDALRGAWDVVVHTAASTRWTMTKDEAVEANIRPTEALLDLVGPTTHLIHVSTAYVGGADAAELPAPSEFGQYRNGYEWSKAQCEDLVRQRHDGPLTVVRPPLILGSRADGAICRFSGPYTLLQTLVSGLAAAVVGTPDGYAEVAPVDQVADVIAQAVLAVPPSAPVTHTIAAGSQCMRLSTLLDITCATLNDWRAERGVPPIQQPPFIDTKRWHRFFLPLAKRELSEIQHHAVTLLGMFESYTSMPQPFEPTHQVHNPEELLVRSIRWWAERKPRLAAKTPEPWGLVS